MSREKSSVLFSKDVYTVQSASSDRWQKTKEKKGWSGADGKEKGRGRLERKKGERR